MKQQRLVIWCAVSKPDTRKRKGQEVEDKYSLSDQEAMGRAFAADNEYETVRVFLWPGHSRDESDPVQALEDFAAVGRNEYHELRELWRSKAFDVLWCHNHSRLGRSFTMQSWVIENVIRAGAKIYRHVGGWIRHDDYGGQIALGGFSNIQERERRIIQNDAGLTARASKGLNVARVPYPHRLIRDPDTGKAIRMEIDPSNRAFLNDLHALLLEDVGFKVLGRELYTRFGHSNPDTGKAWGNVSLYNMLHRPSFWGHTARKFRKVVDTLSRDGWGYDKAAPVPPGVILFRDTHEPAYTGEQADDVMSVLRFRKTNRGAARPSRVRALSGLAYCAHCLRRMRIAKGTAKYIDYDYVYCSSHYDYIYMMVGDDCPNNRHIRDYYIKDFIEDLITRAQREESPETLFPRRMQLPPTRLEAIQDDIERQQVLLDRLILQAAGAGDTLNNHYRKLINGAAETLERLESERERLIEQSRVHIEHAQRREKALSQLSDIPITSLWQTPGPKLNRLLKDFLNPYRIFVLNGEIVRLDLCPPQRTYRRKPTS